MSRRAKSKPTFKRPYDFSFFPTSGRYGCTVCWPVFNEAEHYSMIAHSAMRHESSIGHIAKVEAMTSWDIVADPAAWADSTQPNLFGSKTTERMEFVDQLRDFIPFWQDSIEAAERGETLRFEDFLEKVRRKDAVTDGWGPSASAANWGLHTTSRSSSLDKDCNTQREARTTLVSSSSEGSEPSGFAEMVAQLSPAVNRKRRQRMRSFYKVPTHTKVERIQQLIHDIQGTPT